MLSLVVPWPRPDGKWLAILSPQEAFSGFGSVAVIMVTAMFAFSASMIRTGAAEMIGGRLFRACAHHELLLQAAILSITAFCSMFINEATIVLVFMPVVLVILAPIAYQIAYESHADPKPFMVGMAICISTSFCTPVAHETTMLVMGPGRYRFKNYLSIGSGMAVIAWLRATFVTPKIWKF